MKKEKLYIKDDKERAKAESELKELIEKADRKIYQIVTKVSNSGMHRWIKNMIVIENEIMSIDWHICRVLPRVSYSEYGVGISGCGMDMGFKLVYSLVLMLFPNEPKNPNGGYAIKHVWI